MGQCPPPPRRACALAHLAAGDSAQGRMHAMIELLTCLHADTCSYVEITQL
jgi:hypothetical protein